MTLPLPKREIRVEQDDDSPVAGCALAIFLSIPLWVIAAILFYLIALR